MLKICLFSLFLSLSLGQDSYCISGPTTVVDTTLYQISLQGDSSSITDPSLACPGGQGYANVKDLTMLMADLTQGQTYQISYNVSTCGGLYAVRSMAWIDYDTDNNFFDEDEQLFWLSDDFGYQTWNFTVPLTSHLGNTRLRVQVQEISGVTAIDPCAPFTYGGTTDFSVSIKPPGPVYCPPGPTTGDDMNLGPVHFEGFTENIHEESDCPGVIGGADLTALIADVNPGGSYTLRYKITDCDPDSQPWATLSGAWIDYDQDSDFEDWELLGITQQTEVADIVLQFTVPLTKPEEEVKTGNTRMRVQVQETNAEVLDSCAQFAWGGTKDFSIRVLEAMNYCVSGPTSPADTTIASISVIGQTESINDPAGCSVMQIGPVDHTNLIADIPTQTPVSISWNIATCGRATPTMSAAWADYNHNEVFESWEQITPRFSTSTISTSFKVPPTSTNQVVVGGPTRLRVQAQETTVNAALDPCAQFTGGATIDLTLNIILPAEEAKAMKTVNATNYGGRGRYSRIEALKF